MEAIWNRMHLEHPPNAVCHVECEKFDATEFLTTINKVIKDLTSQELLHKEAAILSRLIYRMKRKFRNDKGVKAMSKINQALLRYLSLSLEKEYENLKDYVEIGDKYVTLPTKQMVECVLIKTQGFAKLMLRVEEISKYSAHFLKCRISLGHAWSIAIIAYSVVSRIWLLSRYLVKISCSWYNDLYRYLKLLEASGLPWLPKNVELPDDLKSWLSVSWIDEPTPSVPSKFGIQNTMFKLVSPREYDSDNDLFIDTQDRNNETKSENASSRVERESTTLCAISKAESKNIILNDDPGEIMDRRAFNLKRLQSVPTNTKRENKEFIKREERGESSQEIYSEGVKETVEGYPLEKKRAKKDRKAAKKLTKLTKQVTCASSKKLSTFDDAKDEADLVALLNKESYPGLDKLQWNIIRNRSRKLLNESEASSIVFRKVMKRIKKWIS